MPLCAAGEKECTKEGLGVSIEGLHVAKEAGRYPIPKISQKQKLHVFGSLGPAKGADESSLQCLIFVVGGGR